MPVLANPSFYLRSLTGGAGASREQVLLNRDGQLRRLVMHAYRAVPYYRRLFDRAGVKPCDIRTAADLSALPITTKDDLKSVPPADRLARGVDPARLVASSTSGSSGEPFTVLRTRMEQTLMMPFWLRARRSYGIRPTDRSAAVVFMEPSPGRGHRRIRWALGRVGLYRSLRVDCRRPTSEIMGLLSAYRPDSLGGYSGAIAHLAVAVSEAGCTDIRPRVVAAGAEALTPLMRRQIAEAFGARVYTGYGCLELNLVAWECAETGELHTCDDGVIIEVLRDGRPVRPGEEGEVVGTSLLFCAMPFIRYRLGDVVVQGSEGCRCGAPFATLRAVRGRVLDYLTLPDGRAVHPYALADTAVDTAGWIRQWQIVQDRADSIVMHVVPSGAPAEDCLNRLHRAALRLFGPEVRFRVDFVSEIERGPGGKYPMVRSQLRPAGTEASHARS